MMIRPRWNEAQLLCTTALTMVDRGEAHISTCVALTAQFLHQAGAVRSCHTLCSCASNA